MTTSDTRPHAGSARQHPGRLVIGLIIAALVAMTLTGCGSSTLSKTGTTVGPGSTVTVTTTVDDASTGVSTSPTSCGDAPGGSNTSGPDTELAVTAGAGVSCSTAIAVITTVGQEPSSAAQDPQSGIGMYYEVDGWHCNAFNQDTQNCSQGKLTITASEIL